MTCDHILGDIQECHYKPSIRTPNWNFGSYSSTNSWLLKFDEIRSRDHTYGCGWTFRNDYIFIDDPSYFTKPGKKSKGQWLLRSSESQVTNHLHRNCLLVEIGIKQSESYYSAGDSEQACQGVVMHSSRNIQPPSAFFGSSLSLESQMMMTFPRSRTVPLLEKIESGWLAGG